MSETCYSFPNPAFQPAMRVITAITNAYPAEVTTSLNHLYVTGMIVRLDIPLGVGMQQANQQTGTIVVTGSTTFVIGIDTTKFDPFVIPVSPPANYTCAQVVPFSQGNDILTASVQNVLPGSRLPGT